MANRIGEQFGNYHLIRQIGEGGFAEVYLGEHIYFTRKVAIKISKAQLGKVAKAGFLQEARNLANLEHEHIVRIVDFGIHTDETPYLVMDYAPNGSLGKKHPRNTQLPLSTVVEYVKQIADALQYAHNKGLVHCDIKPDNILLGRNGQLLLSDFGIAVIARSTSYQNIQGILDKIIATIAYAAPEQLKGRSRPASDQYSLGITVYEWLTGNVPFQGTQDQIVIQHRVDMPEPLHTKVSDIPSMAEQVIMKALAKEPYQRFASVQEFAIMLEKSLDTQPKPDNQRKNLQPPKNVQPSLNPYSSMPTILLPNIPVTPVTPELPYRRIGTQICSYREHKGDIKSIAWFPQLGRLIASAGSDNQVHLWNTEDGKRSICYTGHTNTIRDIAWSPDGSYLVSASYDKTVRVWNSRKKEHEFTYRGHTQFLKQVAWQPRGILIASLDEEGSAHVWNLSTGMAAFTGEAQAFAWSPNGERIVFAKARLGQIWNVMTEHPTQKYDVQNESINFVTWSPDGTHIAFSSDVGTQVWNTNLGRRVFTLKNISFVEWSPDGKYIAGIKDNEVIIYHANSDREYYVHKGHHVYVNSISWSRDSLRVASASDDSTVQIWNASNGRNLYTYTEHKAIVQFVIWSPDGKQVASFSNGQGLNGNYDEQERVIHIWVGA